MPAATVFTEAQKARMAGTDTHANLAAEFGLGSNMAVRRYRDKINWTPAPRSKSQAPALGKVETTINREKGEATIVGPEGSSVDELIRENGLDPAEWVVITTTLNKWEALGAAVDGENPIKTLRQVKVTLRLRPEILFAQPVTPAASFKLRSRSRHVYTQIGGKRYSIVEYDHQAPYHDRLLDAALTELHADIQPDEQLFGGDGMDFPRISRHDDHPAAMASNQECVDEFHGILVRRTESSPDSRRRKIRGNHDWRLDAEQLQRAERIYGLRPAGESEPALSLRRLLQLDALGVELVTSPLGWKHDEIVIVPGYKGLVMRHGWLTGHNTAGRSMAKRGRSILVGHTHGRESVYWWDPSAEVERQAHVVGCACMVRGGAELARVQAAGEMGLDVEYVFPNFAALDGWTPGAGIVTTYDDGTFNYEHALWNGSTLTWSGGRYQPTEATP